MNNSKLLNLFLCLVLAAGIFYPVPHHTLAGGISAKIISDNPIIANDRSKSFVQSTLAVTNDSDQVDEVMVENVQPPAGVTLNGFGWIFAPTPVLVLQPHQTSNLLVRFSGFDAPSTQGLGPPDGTYTVTITLRSLVHTDQRSTVPVQVTVKDLASQPDPIMTLNQNITAPKVDPSKTVNTGFPTYRLAASSDHSVIATLPGFYRKTDFQSNGNLTVMDGSGTTLFTFALPNQTPLTIDNSEWTATDGGVAVTKDGSKVALGWNSGQIFLFDKSGKKLWQYDGTGDQNSLIPGFLGQGIIYSSEVDFSPDGSLLAAGSLSGFAYLFDSTTGKKLWSFATSGQVRAFHFLKDGSLLVGSGDNTLYKIDKNGKEVWRAPLTFWPWEQIGVSADESVIVTGGKDGFVRVFNAAGKEQWHKDFNGYIQSTVVGPDNSIYVLSGHSGLYAFKPNGDQIWKWGEGGGTSKLALSASGRLLAFGRGQGNGSTYIVVVDTQTGQPVWQFAGAQQQAPSGNRGLQPAGQAPGNNQPVPGGPTPNTPLQSIPQPGSNQPSGALSGSDPGVSTIFQTNYSSDGQLVADSQSGKVYFFAAQPEPAPVVTPVPTTSSTPAASQKPAATPPPNPNATHNYWGWGVGALILIILLCLALWLIVRRKKQPLAVKSLDKPEQG